MFGNSMAEWARVELGVVDPKYAVELGLPGTTTGTVQGQTTTGGTGLLLDFLATPQAKLAGLLAAVLVSLLVVGSERETRRVLIDVKPPERQGGLRPATSRAREREEAR